jgi:hypothetical protein
MKVKKYLIAFILICIASFSVYADELPTITFYTPTFIPCFDQDNNLLIAIRTYFYNNVPYYLVVNPYTLNTYTAPVSSFKQRKINQDPKDPGYYTMAELKATPYVNALFQYSSPPYFLKDYGMIHAAHPVEGYFLTIDLCPSVKPFEADFFAMLVKKSVDENQPVPVAISITGLWLIGHPDEFNWLIQQEKMNKLNITWVNHTYDHVYYYDLPFKNNFLTTKIQMNNDDDVTPNNKPLTLEHLKFETLFTEQLLLQRGETPSIFFRFPGLASNSKLILELKKMGLIPLGTDAWVYKIGKTNSNSDQGELLESQEIKNGSIVLVHGNSNEHPGILSAMPIVQPASFHLLPISQAIVP